MTETQRRAIVWDRIEQLAFRPWDKEKSWLRDYSKQLRYLLQLEPVWIKDGSQGCFQITELKIACEYKLESENAYIAFLKKTEDERTIWSVHADAAYLSKAALHMAEVDYPETEIDTHLRSDIVSVLEGMLFHPRNHSHLSAVGFTTAGDTDPSCGMLKAVEIRVSSSAYNGFVFLYHIAYQLCVVSDQARDNEKTRLIDLFETSIRNKQKVNARELFNF
ncbi:MAG: hypothetical protein ABIN18_07715 [Pseudomonadota bacterium]